MGGLGFVVGCVVCCSDDCCDGGCFGGDDCGYYWLDFGVFSLMVCLFSVLGLSLNSWMLRLCFVLF